MARLRPNLLRWSLVVLAGIAMARSARAGIMVVVAHPDDDVILSAGVVHAARLRGEQVTVVYVTNGELVGGPVTGLARQGEAVNAQGFLGVAEHNLVFLGYPDNRLGDLYGNPALANAGAVLTTVHGQSVTFGNRGLGHADYHQHRFGMHASFNKKNMLADLVDVIGKYRPTHILTHADFDVHPDHKTVSIAVRDATKAVAGADTSYLATLFHGLVWSIDAKVWPLPSNPTTYLTEPPGLGPTGVRWVDRNSIDVPRSMQSTTPELNPKYLAINAHESQGGSGAFIGKSIHRDEVFWAENPLGNDRPPRVDAGPPQSAAPGASVQLDGSRSGDLDGPVTFYWTQRDGPPVTLANADTARPTFTVPADITKDEIITFGLVVSQGALHSLEDRATVKVSMRTEPTSVVTNIAPRAKVTASSARPGQEAHKVVDEMVGGAPKDPSQEWVSDGERAGAWLHLEWAGPFSVERVVLHDRPALAEHVSRATIVFDGGVSYAAHPIDNTGAGFALAFPAVTTKTMRIVVDMTSPETTAAGLAEVVVYGAAGLGGGSAHAASDGNIAALASVSASSPPAGGAQDASKAVDGVVDGYPTDYTKEWVTSGERTGAWLLLEWTEPHVIDRIVLHDRINATDNVASATLRLDDGRPLATGPLPADGSGREVKFPPVFARKLRVTLTATKPGTQNAGLAEIEVYESTLPPAAPPSRGAPSSAKKSAR